MATDTPLTRPLPKPARRPWLPAALVFVMAVILVDALVGDHGFAASIRARQEYTRVQAALNAVRADNAALQERQRQLTSDRRAIERLAREEMGFTRRGEILFIVTPVVVKAPGERPPAR